MLDRDLSADNWYQPHSEGGKIYFDTETGQIQWQPTNVDVTIGDSGQRVHTAYQFKITANDGIDSNTETFSLDVTNTATDITTDIVLKQFTQGSALTVTDAEVTAIDEYHSSADDYYTLEILFNNTGEWIRVDNGDYNTQNNSWHGADIDYTTNNFVKTGAFDWTPVNSDVPNVLIGGEYQHQFRITHYDGHGSSDTDTFFVKVDNVPPTLDVTASHSYALIEDTTTLHITDGEVSSSEEGYGVTYILKVSSDGGTSWTTLHDGDQINGPDGGVVHFVESTGQIDWAPTNGDVTSNPVRPDYQFSIQADDHTPSPGNLSADPPFVFTVSVANDPASIEADLGGGNHVTFSDPAFPIQSVPEDGTYSLNLYAKDEQVESTTHFSDAYYELVVDGHSMVDGNGYAAGVSDYYYTFASGSAIHFNKDTGEINWTTNNLDVGDHEFIATHKDGHGDEQPDSFYVTVKNTAPVYQGLPAHWQLTEDDTNAGTTTLDIQTDDEGQGGVTYSLTVNGHAVDPTAGYRPNGSEGGLVTVNPTTGEIHWSTTNADTTQDLDGHALSGLNPYVFEVTADDGHSSHATTVDSFNVDVKNTGTNIDVSPEFNPGGVWDIYEDPERTGHHADNTFDIHAIDERQESTDSSYFRDTYYTLAVNGATWTTGYGPNTGVGGNAIEFNVDTGVIYWDANNLDVGSYDFAVTHYDGHNHSDPSAFTTVVHNSQPTLDVPTEPVKLVEDHPGLISGPDITSDDEGYGVTYSLKVNGGAADPAGYRPNGPDGGLIILDTATGQITWDTTNADVTRDVDGNPLVGVSDYTFEITANDGHTTDNTNLKTFSVLVWNDPTLIDKIYADGYWYENANFQHGKLFDRYSTRWLHRID